MILNALNVDPRKPWKQGAPWRWYSEEMLNCCIDLETIKKTGITFSTFVCLAKCQGLCADGYYASQSSLEEFQRIVEYSCCGGGASGGNASSATAAAAGSGSTPRLGDGNGSNSSRCQECNTLLQEPEQHQPKMYLAVSYNRQVLQQTGTGHFSPIAAYDKVSNHVLILDTARFKYTPHWVPLDMLFQAMLSVDPQTNKSRGFIALSFEPDERICSAGSLSSLTVSCLYLPQSILFRSKRSQNAARRQFKEFLGKKNDNDNDNDNDNYNGPIMTTSSLTLEQVYDYWTDCGTNIRKVWSILEPAPIPIDKEGCGTVQALLSLIRHLLSRSAWSNVIRRDIMDDKFVPCSMRTVPITALETIYVIYLSTMERRDASEAILKGMESIGSLHDGNNIISSSSVNSSLENGQLAAVETTTNTSNDVVSSQLLAEADLIKKAIELSNYQSCSRGGCCS
jgi:glutathione gamma-glutamylcysteinyltransferase